jgi:hypothetical protein
MAERHRTAPRTPQRANPDPPHPNTPPAARTLPGALHLVPSSRVPENRTWHSVRRDAHVGTVSCILAADLTTIAEGVFHRGSRAFPRIILNRSTPNPRRCKEGS